MKKKAPKAPKAKKEVKMPMKGMKMGKKKC